MVSEADHRFFMDWWEGYRRVYPPEPALEPRGRAEREDLKVVREGVGGTDSRMVPGGKG